MIFKYENAPCDIDLSFFRDDAFCFSVLARILKESPALTITDKSSFVICHSSPPHPVWVWIRNEATLGDMEMVYDLLKMNFGFDGTYRFNTKPFFARYIMAREPYEIFKNLMAYSCPTPKAPKRCPAGHITRATEQDIELLSQYIEDFSNSVGIEPLSATEAKEHATDIIKQQNLYFWIDENGEKVATCRYRLANGQGSINTVYVRPDKRRCGYGAILVYEVTKMVIALGHLPVLYADADYKASNACYESIGYILHGSVSTIYKK